MADDNNASAEGSSDSQNEQVTAEAAVTPSDSGNASEGTSSIETLRKEYDDKLKKLESNNKKLLDEKKDKSNAAKNALLEQGKFEELSKAVKEENDILRSELDVYKSNAPNLESERAQLSQAVDDLVSSEIDSLSENHKKALLESPGYANMAKVDQLNQIRWYKKTVINETTSPGGESPAKGTMDAEYDKAAKQRNVGGMLSAGIRGMLK